VRARRVRAAQAAHAADAPRAQAAAKYSGARRESAADEDDATRTLPAMFAARYHCLRPLMPLSVDAKGRAAAYIPMR